MHKPFPSALLIALTLLSGCTNVAGDASRQVVLLSGGAADAGHFFSIANAFFSEAGYDCNEERAGSRLRCARALRDLYIHQTTAVVEIVAADDAEASYQLVPTRWDEGLIPGEFISSTYSSDDVEAFCVHLITENLARCNKAG